MNCDSSHREQEFFYPLPSTFLNSKDCNTQFDGESNAVIAGCNTRIAENSHEYQNYLNFSLQIS
jgi:hypothetical protein